MNTTRIQKKIGRLHGLATEIVDELAIAAVASEPASKPARKKAPLAGSCPGCGGAFNAEHLRESEECTKVCASIAGTLAVSKRKEARGGRPRKVQPEMVAEVNA